MEFGSSRYFKVAGKMKGKRLQEGVLVPEATNLKVPRATN